MTAGRARYLIVNADDLGLSRGVTRGILDCHARGIVTSASLMVETPWSPEAAALAREAPALSVGLHAVLPAREHHPGPDAARAAAALARQMDRFTALMGCRPTHLDSHHDAHRDPRVWPAFLELSRRHGLPLRGASAARHFPGFYGRWAGESHPEHIGVESLLGMLAREVGEGITELSCHPGYPDPREPSGYAGEREVEARTLCDPRVRAGLEPLGIRLASFHDFDRLTAVVSHG